MKKPILAILIIYLLWIGFIIGDPMAIIGTVSSPHIYPWYTPLSMVTFMLSIALPSFIIGKEWRRK